MPKITVLIVLFFLVSSCVSMQSKEIKLAREMGASILITDASQSYPNSAGGIDLRLHFHNTSNKTFKYIVFDVTPLNAVGDVVASEIGNKRTAYLNVTGPYAADTGNTNFLIRGSVFTNIWYNHSIRCSRLDKVSITFMDGSTDRYERNVNISKILAGRLSNGTFCTSINW